MPDSTKLNEKTRQDLPDLYADGRQPSGAELQWAKKTLAPTLEKSPEKPIGAPTGTNLDEHGNGRFTTI